MVQSFHRGTITKDTPLAELVLHVQRRDYAQTESFEELYQRHSPTTLKLIARLVQDKQAAEDLHQDTFIAVWVNLPQKKPDVPFIPWLNRIAANRACDYLRHIKKVKFLSLSENETEAEERQIQPPLISKEMGPEEKACLKDAVETILNELDAKTRFCFLLHNQWGLSQAEIADILRPHIPTIDQRRISEYLCRARKRLRQLHPDMMAHI